MNVLVVDDDRFLGEYVCRALIEAGHRATYIDSTMKAVATAHEQSFDMLLCDLVLPDLNGIHAIRFIRNRLPNLPVVVLSSLDPNQWEAKCREAGAACYLHKPVSIEKLLAEVALVEASIVKLNIGLVDGDTGHRARLQWELKAMGCGVKAWSSFEQMLVEPAEHEGITLLLLDIAAGDPGEGLRWASERRVAAVAFGAPGAVDADEMLRLGASLCVHKPVDGHSLVVQARFLVGA